MKGNDTCYNVDEPYGSERSQAQKVTCYMIPFILSIQKKQSHRKADQPLPGAGGEGNGMTA